MSTKRLCFTEIQEPEKRFSASTKCYEKVCRPVGKSFRHCAA